MLTIEQIIKVNNLINKAQQINIKNWDNLVSNCNEEEKELFYSELKRFIEREFKNI